MNLTQTDPGEHAVPGGFTLSAGFLDFLRNGKKFLIAGHKEPDGDCVGSQLALVSILRRLGKEALPCSAGPFKRTEVKPYEHLFASAVSEQDRAGASVIMVDCSAPERAGSLEKSLEGLPLALIDHHAPGAAFTASAAASGEVDSAGPPAYVDKSAPSTTFLILNLYEALGLEPTREEAELLFFGLCTDTGFFRHLGGEGAETFAAAARLIRAGANPREAYAAINGGKSLNSRRLLGNILGRAEPFFDGKLILSSESYEESRCFGFESRDSDSLYRLLQTIAGVEAVVIIRQETPAKCTVGFRSKDWLDVRRIAESFGGGGHKNAAGLSVEGTIAELKPKILDAFKICFPPSADFNKM